MPNPNRLVHPHIADFVSPQSPRHGTGPMLQYPDGVWNHGEALGAPADTGGWHGIDLGLGVVSGNVLTQADWHSHTWVQPLHPLGHLGVPMQRFVGCLRPVGVPLPVASSTNPHPRYPSYTGQWVDQGAFELFRHNTSWAGLGSQQKIVICIGLFPTQAFPEALAGKFEWPQRYMGIFSPDGLIRRESTNYATNISPLTEKHPQDTIPGVIRPLTEQVIGTWSNPSYYPIAGYAVSTVCQRQTELIQQRCLQLVGAIKAMLMENSTRNPVGVQLTAEQVKERVVVVFAGGSNGGLQGCWANLLYPSLVHGTFSQTMNPSVQRLFGEQELGYAVAALTGAASEGADFDPIDMRNWCHFAWNRGLEVHDLSVPRRFVRNETFRPFCFYVGDEDITSTGTDWIRVMSGTTFQPSGIATPAPYWAGGDRSIAWMSAEKRCHDSGLVANPYGGSGLTLHESDVVHDLIARAITNRAAELASPLVALPDPPLQHLPRATGEDLRGLDDPQEWFHGRDGDPAGLPPPGTGPFIRDDAWSGVGTGSTVQPGAAGTWLGHKEAMLIHSQRVYVGSAEGLVSSFEVDTSQPERPLRRVAQSRQLGQQAWGLCVATVSGSSSIIAATRRRLHRLDPATLAVTGSSPLLPWEVAKPYRLKVGSVLPGHPVPQIIFASVHGGLVFVDVNTLQPIWEWPEPGIQDFVLQGSTVTIMSERGVVANVVFELVNGLPKAKLAAVSAPLELTPNDPPCQGVPWDLERVSLDFGGLGTGWPAIIGLWKGDTDGLAVRVFMPDSLDRVPAAGLQQIQNAYGSDSGLGVDDLATCKVGGSSVGDHILVLSQSNLILFNEFGQKIGRKMLFQCKDAQNNAVPYLFGRQACSIAVGELGVTPQDTTSYTEEIVVATQTGRLMWLHVSEVLGTDPYLPPAYVGAVGGSFSHIQPRTNQALPATWAISGPVDASPKLHMLDQSGNYWRVGATGSPELIDRNALVANRIAWNYVGAVGTINQIPPWIPTGVQDSPLPWGIGWVWRSWAAEYPLKIPFENQQHTGHQSGLADWRLKDGSQGVFHGFIPSEMGGSAAVIASGETHMFEWMRTDKSANLLRGLRIRASTVDGVWASTLNQPYPSAPPYGYQQHDLRSEPAVPAMNLQAVRVMPLSSGGPAVVLGCPGGRVRIVRPGIWSDSLTPAHGLGTLASIDVDLGHGGGALAVQDGGTGSDLNIWFGTAYSHIPRPAAFSAGSLGDGEVLAGSVTRMTWNASTGFNVGATRLLTPAGSAGLAGRGGFGVCGLAVDDLLPASHHPNAAGVEVIVTTLAGDLLVMSGDLQNTFFQTWVDGAVGCNNSIVVVDLDGDNKKEIYLAGSRGVWRFVQP